LVRLLCGGRINFRPRALVRPFAGVDGELALAPSASGVASEAPLLPRWTVGVSVGVTVGSP
jgi:hypothetical protein